MENNVADNTGKSRFELLVDGHIAFADYRKEGGILYIKYVEAPPALRGTGAAGRLMEGITTIARGEGLKIVPICGYAASWLQKHKEYRDLMA